MDNEKVWFTLGEFMAAVYGNTLSKSCILQQIKKGLIPAERFAGGRKILIPRWFVEEQINKGLRKDNKEAV